MSEYTFVFGNAGWWLEILSKKELDDYHKKTDLDRYGSLNPDSKLYRDARENELRCLKWNGAVYINRVGGHTFPLKITKRQKNTQLNFPD